MKSFPLLLCVVLAAISTKADETPATVKSSEINAVRVFRAKAQITRKVTFSSPVGNTVVIVKDLSPAIDSKSIQVKGKGNFTILNVENRIDYINTIEAGKRVRSLQDSLKLLIKELQRLEDQEYVAKGEISVIEKNTSSIKGESNGLNTEALVKAANYFSLRLKELKPELRSIQAELEKLRERKFRIEQQLNESNAQLNQPSGSILVFISTNSPINGELELNYIVENAGWEPVYSLSAAKLGAPVQLQMKAKVFQMSGEEWKNVQLSLSTANPTVGGDIPQLSPWWLRFEERYMLLSKPQLTYEWSAEAVSKKQAEEKAKAESANKARIAAEAKTEADARGYEESLPAETIETNANTSGLAMDYLIDRPYSIPSDPNSKLIDVKSFEIVANYRYASNPKLDRDAFLISELTDWEKYSLLPGPANVFYEGAFVGETYIHTDTNTNDTLVISFGRDQAITIKRDVIKTKTGDKLFSDKRQKSQEIEVVVKNNKDKTISIDLNDQIPVSGDKEIKVSLDSQLTNATLDPETGIIKWKLDVQPFQELKLRFAYTISYPKNRIISGL